SRMHTRYVNPLLIWRWTGCAEMILAEIRISIQRRGITMRQCSFCRQTEDEVSKLVAGPDVYICDECVRVAVRLMREPGLFTKAPFTSSRNIQSVRIAVRCEEHMVGIGLHDRSES